MSIVSVNEWDTFLNLFSQNGIGDLLRQEIKVLRKLYFIKQITEQNSLSFMKNIKSYARIITNCLRDEHRFYRFYNEGEELICSKCNRTVHYYYCIKCNILPELRFPTYKKTEFYKSYLENKKKKLSITN